MTTKLYVGNLPWSTTREELSELFSRFGEVTDSFIPLDRETGRPRGFGFVTLAQDAAMQACQEMDGTEFTSRFGRPDDAPRTIRVNEAAPPGQGGGRGGFGGGRGGRGGRGGFY